MIDKMGDILNTIGLVKIFFITSAYIAVILKIEDMQDKTIANGFKALGICFCIFVISGVMYYIFSIFDFQTGMNVLAHIGLLTGFLIVVPLMLLLLELFS